MLPRLPPAVYKCIIPVEKRLTASSTVCHSPLDDQSRKAALPFPAWPEIEDPYQSCCLPTLMRALYFHQCGLRVEPEVTARRAEEYLSRPEVIEPGISEQVIAFTKSQPSFSQHPFSLTHLHVSTNINNYYVQKINICSEIGLIKKLDNSADRVPVAFMQALIYGNLKNFPGEEDAFSYAHEIAHRYAGVLHGGVFQEELSKLAHKILDRLATEEFSREQATELWKLFVSTNEQITDLALKYEPIEEIFATYVGMCLLPTKVRNKVKKRVKKKLEEKNWYKTYTSFAEACDQRTSFAETYANRQATQLEGATYIFEDVCLMLKQIDIDAVYLLHKLSEISKIICSIEIKRQENGINQDVLLIDRDKAEEKIDSLLEKWGIPGEILVEAMNNARNYFLRCEEDPEALLSSPEITLVGRASRKEITPFITASKPEDEDNIIVRIFYESIRQQLSKPYGIICPFAYKGKPCCGLKERLQRLYKRLPEEDRNHFNQPNCDLIR